MQPLHTIVIYYFIKLADFLITQRSKHHDVPE
jgi:hypothetical protein